MREYDSKSWPAMLGLEAAAASVRLSSFQYLVQLFNLL
jgi:hypothetical protein